MIVSLSQALWQCWQATVQTCSMRRAKLGSQITTHPLTTRFDNSEILWLARANLVLRGVRGDAQDAVVRHSQPGAPRGVARAVAIHPVSVTRFPSFRTQTLENLSRYLWNKWVPEQPRPWRKSCEGESCCGDQVYYRFRRYKFSMIRLIIST